MKQVDGWWWPDGERHMLDWIASPKNRVMLHDRPAYQGKKQLACLAHLGTERRTMIDVGAHIGLWSYNFGFHFDKIEAFEPVVDHQDCWLKNMTGKHMVALHPYALGDHEAMVSISVNPTSSGDSWIKGKGVVQMRTLDSFQYDNVDFIKVDCEGYEEFVLRGAEATLREWKPLVCVEQKRDMAAKFKLKPLGAVEYLKDLGYRLVQEIGGDYIMQHRG